MQPKKYYGQNFISDSHLINRIINLLEPELNSDALVFEIGPGKGALTNVLTKHFKTVVTIEIDHDLVKLLKQQNQSSNLNIIEADVLKVDWPKLINQYQRPHQKVFLISNLPYYITSPILFKVYQNYSLFNRAVFMMQKEVAERITANKDNKTYNNLSVISQFFGKIDLPFVVPKSFFQPQPKVDSAIIKIDFFSQTNQTKIDQKLTPEFVVFVRQLFNNRRKTILNNLTRLTNDKNLAAKHLNLVRIEPSLRPENLSLDNFIDLFTSFKKLSKID